MRLLGEWAERLANAEAARGRPLLPVRVDLPRVAGDIQTIATAEAAQAWCESLQSVPLAALAFDSEYNFTRPRVPLNSGKHWYDIRSQRPICVSVAAWALDYGQPEAGHILRAVLDVRVPEVVPYLDAILRLRVPLVFHHAKVELFTFCTLGLDPDVHNLYDTRVAAACLHLGRDHRRAQATKQIESEEIQTQRALAANKAHRLSLVGQCAEHNLAFPFSGAKDDLRDAFLNLNEGAPLTDRMVAYASADAEWTLKLYAVQQKDALLQGLGHHLHTVEFPFALANARMEWRGAQVDPGRRDQLRRGAQRAAAHYAEQLRAFGIDPPGSRDRFLQVMTNAGLRHHFIRQGKPCTKKDFLELLEGLHPAVRPFRLHRRFQRLTGEEWLTGCLTGVDGRTHPNHYQLGTDTGRNTCSTPNLVGIGRILRPVVVAPPYRGILELDYSQVEVGVAAAEHGDSDLVTAYNSGDVYATMAMRFYADQLSETASAMDAAAFKHHHPGLRDSMKTFVLAVLYNIQAPTLAARFEVSVEQAESERTRFLDMFPVLKQRLEESAAYGAVRGYASVVTGLRRQVENRGKPSPWTRNFLRNTPIQGSAASVFKYAMVLMDRAFRGSNTWLILPVHDAIVIECQLDELHRVAETASRLMADALRTFYPQLMPKVEVNCTRPECWNKDGHADSLDRFLDDPTFRIEGKPVPDELGPAHAPPQTN